MIAYELRINPTVKLYVYKERIIIYYFHIGVSNMQTKIGIGGGKNGSNEWNKKRHAKNDDANTSSTAKVVRIYSQHQHLLYHIDHLSSLSPSTSSFRSFPSTSTMSIALPDNDNTAIFNTLRILPLAEQIHAHCISLPKLVCTYVLFIMAAWAHLQYSMLRCVGMYRYSHRVRYMYNYD